VNDAVEGVFKVVEEHELEYHTGHGWQIVSVLPEVRTEKLSGKGINPQYLADMMKNNYSSEPELLDTEHFAPVSVHKYLLRKSINTRLDELNDSLNTALKRCSETIDEADKLRESNEEFAAVSKRQVAEADMQRERANAGQAREREMRAAVEAMENDIAAVRTAIGADRMKEIIGAEDDKPF
jgi:hypothetical protein